MRKRFVQLNAMVRSDQTWNAHLPSLKLAPSTIIPLCKTVASEETMATAFRNTKCWDLAQGASHCVNLRLRNKKG